MDTVIVTNETEKTIHRYVINRLRTDGRKYTTKIMVTPVYAKDGSPGTVEQGIELGTTIENRGSTTSGWSFVGQIESDRRYLEQVSGYGIDDTEFLEITGIDLTGYGTRR